MLLEIEKKKSNKLIFFSETTRIDWSESLVQAEQAEPEKQRKYSYEEINQELGISGNTGTITK